MLLIVAALTAFVVVITVRYRDGLVQRLRTDLISGADALATTRTPRELKPLIGSLAAEGISVDLAGISGPGGSLQFSPGGALLTVHEVIPVGGTNTRATLTGERLLRDQPARPARDAIEAQLARDSGRLGHLIDELLNLARLDARERPHREPVELTDLASAAVAATRTADPAVRVELVTNGPVPAIGDRDALLRALRNLIDNAIAAGDHVVVEATQRPGGPIMSVSDNGPGVPADQRERIFEPFVRLPGNRRAGTGLGLAIVRRTIESHGGTVTCDPSPTGGARFTLRLPADA